MFDGAWDLTLLRPAWLLLLPALLLAEWVGRQPPREEGSASGSPWERIVAPNLLPALWEQTTGAGSGAAPNHRLTFRIGYLLACFALAGPAFESAPAVPLRPDTTRLIVVDLSAKMNRDALQRLPIDLKRVLAGLPRAENGLVVYAGSAFLVVPPTLDVETLLHWTQELTPASVPVAGNRPDLAWPFVLDALSRAESRHREILWIGRPWPNDLSPLPPPPDKSGVRLNFLQITGSGQIPEPQRQAIQATGGRLLVQTTPTGPSQENDLTRWVQDPARNSLQIRELGPWLLLLSVAFLASGLANGGRLLTMGLLVVSSQFVTPPADAREADPRWQAVALYRAGNYEAAVAQLAGLNDAVSHHNRGNALARLGRLTEALAAYEASLAIRPENVDTRHNRDLVASLLQSPAPKSPPPPAPRNDAEREANRIAEAWLKKGQQPPDAPKTLLQRTLAAEHQRRMKEGGPLP